MRLPGLRFSITSGTAPDVVYETVVDGGHLIEVDSARKIIRRLAFQQKVHCRRDDPLLVRDRQADPFQYRRIRDDLYLNDVIAIAQ